MQNINEKSHYATVLSTLIKDYKLFKTGKVNKPNNIYILNIIYKLLSGCCLDLTDIEKKKLNTLYKDILYKSKNICPVDINEGYQLPKKDKFVQAEIDDCKNDIPLTKIYYWQENSIVSSIDNIKIDMLDNNYFTLKLFDTYLNFESKGKTINYSNIGRLCFFALNSNNKNFLITDLLNNDITDIFDIFYDSNLNSTLFVTKNIYSTGELFFKFKTTN